MMDDYTVEVVRKSQDFLDRLLISGERPDLVGRIRFTLRQAIDHGHLDVSALECALNYDPLRKDHGTIKK